MPRYFFNIYDGRDVFDDTGCELRGMREVRMQMLVIAQAWIDLEAHQDAHWRLEARDEDENIVGTMQFGVEHDDRRRDA